MLYNFKTDFFKLALNFTDPFALGEELNAYLKKEFNADRCMIITFNKETEEPEIRSISSDLEYDEYSKTVIKKTIELNGEPYLYHHEGLIKNGSLSLMGKKDLSIISVPLIDGQKIIGVLYLDLINNRDGFHRVKVEEAQDVSHAVLQVLLKQEEILKLQMESKLRKMDYFVGTSKAMQIVYKQIEKAAKAIANVYIHGESGSGKELVARALQSLSDRKNKPFITIDCGAIPKELLESELFGYEKGAFTGAMIEKPGKFELAEEGTLFFDEIGELSIEMQVKLLRAIEQKEIWRVGGTTKKNINTRIIVATRKDLEKEIEKGKFKKEFFYRLNVIDIKVPPLRERMEDIPILAYHFLQTFCHENQKKINGFTTDAIDSLLQHDWSNNNIRELRNIIEKAVVNHEGMMPITANDLSLKTKVSVEVDKIYGDNLKDMTKNVKKYVIRKTLDKYKNCRNKVQKAAVELGIDRTTINKIFES